MFRFRKITAVLNLNANYEGCLDAIVDLAQSTNCEKVNMIHLCSRDLSKLDRTLMQPEHRNQDANFLNQLFQDKMNALKNVEVSLQVMDSPVPATTIANQIESDEANLLLVQDDLEDNFKGLFRKLLADIPCDIIKVSDHWKSGFENIIVPVDFSAKSVTALETAVRFARNTKDKKLELLHIVDVPTGYSKLGQKWNEAAQRMLTVANDRMDKFLSLNQSIHEGIEIKSTYLLNRKPKQGLVSHLMTNPPDLMVLASRGRTKVAQWILDTGAGELNSQLGISILTARVPGKPRGVVNSVQKKLFGEMDYIIPLTSPKHARS